MTSVNFEMWLQPDNITHKWLVKSFSCSRVYPFKELTIAATAATSSVRIYLFSWLTSTEHVSSTTLITFAWCVFFSLVAFLLFCLAFASHLLRTRTLTSIFVRVRLPRRIKTTSIPYTNENCQKLKTQFMYFVCLPTRLAHDPMLTKMCSFFLSHTHPNRMALRVRERRWNELERA